MDKSSNFYPDWEYSEKIGISQYDFLRYVVNNQKFPKVKKEKIKTEITNSSMQAIEKKDSPRNLQNLRNGIEKTLYSKNFEEFIYKIEKIDSKINTIPMLKLTHNELKIADIHDICVLRGRQLWIAPQKDFQEAQEVWVQQKNERKRYKIFCFTEAELKLLRCAIQGYLEKESKQQKSIQMFDLPEAYLLVLKEKVHALTSHLDYLMQLEILTQLETLLADVRLLKQHYDNGGYVSRSLSKLNHRIGGFRILICDIMMKLYTRECSDL